MTYTIEQALELINTFAPIHTRWCGPDCWHLKLAGSFTSELEARHKEIDRLTTESSILKTNVSRLEEFLANCHARNEAKLQAVEELCGGLAEGRPE